MKNLLLKFKGMLGSTWSCALNHYLCVCAVLITSICFLGYNLKITADYEKELSLLSNQLIKSIEIVDTQTLLLNEQKLLLKEQDSYMGEIMSLLQKQGKTLNNQSDELEELKGALFMKTLYYNALVEYMKKIGEWPPKIPPPLDPDKITNSKDTYDEKGSSNT